MRDEGSPFLLAAVVRSKSRLTNRQSRCWDDDLDGPRNKPEYRGYSSDDLPVGVDRQRGDAVHAQVMGRGVRHLGVFQMASREHFGQDRQSLQLGEVGRVDDGQQAVVDAGMRGHVHPAPIPVGVGGREQKQLQVLLLPIDGDSRVDWTIGHQRLENAGYVHRRSFDPPRPPVHQVRHLGIEADSRDGGKVAIVHLADVDTAPRAVQHDPGRGAWIQRDAETPREVVGGALGDDRQGGDRERRATHQAMHRPVSGAVPADGDHDGVAVATGPCGEFHALLWRVCRYLVEGQPGVTQGRADLRPGTLRAPLRGKWVNDGEGASKRRRGRRHAMSLYGGEKMQSCPSHSMLGAMEIVVAKHMGFCGGVKRAVEMAGGTAEAASGAVYTWGPLIHNPQVVSRLQDAGVRVAGALEDLRGDAFVVSAYGVEHAVLDAAKAQGMRVVDATCPVVIRAHSLAFKLVEEGYSLVVVGDHGHPEMVTLKEVLGDKVTIVHDREEAARIKLRGKVAVMSQTTQSQENFRQIVGDLSLRTKELRVVNSLCPAITVRQEEADRMAEEVDALVVIGGHHSANTTRLWEIGQANRLPTFHIEVADELKPDWFEGVTRVGVMSGASTPDWIVSDVLHRLDEIGREHEPTRPTQSARPIPSQAERA